MYKYLGEDPILPLLEYDALIVRSATKVTEEIFEIADNLKLVGRAGTGVDNIDLNAASLKGVLVMNTPGGNTLSAAEHTCAMIAALSRHIGQGYASMLEGKWERSKFMGCELNGKTLGIIGLGRIGREVATRMQAYNVKTVGFDPLVSANAAAEFGVEFLSLEEMWPIVDYVTVHVPLIKPTRGMINKSVFDVCKPGMKVINVARGGIIDEKDLLDALNNGRCGGAALDVFEVEPPKDVSMELVKHAKTLCTPHLGASTTEAQLRVAREIAEQIVDAVNGKPMFGLVNAPALANMGNPVFAPWVQLAQKLGSILGAMEKSASSGKFDIVCEGECFRHAGKLFVSAVALGVAKSKGCRANMISAMNVLKNAGFEVTCKSSTGEALYPSITVIFNGCARLTGVLSRNSPSLSSICGIELNNPITLELGLLLSRPSTATPIDLFNTLAVINLQSVSLGSNGKQAVIAASVTEKKEGLQEPFHMVWF